MFQLILWVVVALLAMSVLSTVLNLGFWLVGTAMFLLWVYSLVDILLLSGMSFIQKVLWGLAVTFFPTVGSLVWLALKPSTQRLLS
ncbi:PLDc N-terminal domain-containing protein [Candidatus Cyanaurora vandensis]|uniref:PLDc N-terminal domain-containing protein n=1 Tax=Candidatus Cyanaurora vandensis TaxID=2714958 RepID=UPI00257A5749|nr:PLDc N-terminal domain-containing protein [Candidatus Cyanaurora vandensis]